jgi:Killing trait
MSFAHTRKNAGMPRAANSVKSPMSWTERGHVDAGSCKGSSEYSNSNSRKTNLARSHDIQPRAGGTSMAFPTAVNDQITDSITQANTKVLGDAPAIALGNLYQATAQALANAAHNATNAQQQNAVLSQTATTSGVIALYSIDEASAAMATDAILNARR